MIAKRLPDDITYGDVVLSEIAAADVTEYVMYVGPGRRDDLWAGVVVRGGTERYPSGHVRTDWIRQHPWVRAKDE